jgi:hypothetical protein
MADEARVDALEQQLQALQTQLAAQTAQIAQQAAQLVQQAAHPVAPQPVQPRPFALTPALANQNVIDLASAQGIKLYKSITTPLDNKFDGTSRELVLFMDELLHIRLTNQFSALNTPCFTVRGTILLSGPPCSTRR